MTELLVWILMGLLTYLHIKFGNHCFRHNLQCENVMDETITILETLFAVFWPLWWLMMYPVLVFIIGKK